MSILINMDCDITVETILLSVMSAVDGFNSYLKIKANPTPKIQKSLSRGSRPDSKI